jgi:hypothetical protein
MLDKRTCAWRRRNKIPWQYHEKYLFQRIIMFHSKLNSFFLYEISKILCEYVLMLINALSETARFQMAKKCFSFITWKTPI